jgi:hypothetical protein
MSNRQLHPQVRLQIQEYRGEITTLDGEKFSWSRQGTTDQIARNRNAAIDAADAHGYQLLQSLEQQAGRPLTTREQVEGRVIRPIEETASIVRTNDAPRSAAAELAFAEQRITAYEKTAKSAVLPQDRGRAKRAADALKTSLLPKLQAKAAAEAEQLAAAQAAAMKLTQEATSAANFDAALKGGA